MRRYAAVLVCGLLLAVALTLPVIAGPGCDGVDDDGVCSSFDNCMLVPNGPLLGTGSCNTQLDGDQDGYGNPCDTDLNNDGATGLDDVSEELTAAAIFSTDDIYDFNCDGGAGLDDVSRILTDAGNIATPGPSGLACAGTIPCP